MENIVQTIVGLFDVLPDYVKAFAILIGGTVTTLTAFTIATPTQIDDAKLKLITVPLNKVLKFINTLAGNIGFNTNVDDTTKVEVVKED